VRKKGTQLFFYCFSIALARLAKGARLIEGKELRPLCRFRCEVKTPDPFILPLVAKTSRSSDSQ
jgi:hypothetical protein